jgi:hypothetical protein
MMILAMRVTIVFSMLLFFVGCSSNSANIVSPDAPSEITSLPLHEDEMGNTDRSLVGRWTLSYDEESNSANVIEYRNADAHYNVTSLLDPPIVNIDFFDPYSRFLELDVRVINILDISGYDVRLIIYTDDDGTELLNAHNWTSLHDIPGGLPLNPFAAINNPNPIYPGWAAVFKLKLHCPGDYNVDFAIDASWPGNCEEPWWIDFRSGNAMCLETGATTLEAYVYDRQDNVNAVHLYCPEITGQTLIPFTQATDAQWEVNLTNNTGAGEGDYFAAILAYSENSELPLYELINITILSCGGEPHSPAVANSLIQFTRCEDIAISGDYAFTVDTVGFKILDITNRENPEIISVLYIKNAECLAVYGNYAYVGPGWNGDITIIDLTDVMNPTIISSFDIDNVLSLIIEDNCLFASCYWETSIFDLSNPSSPELLSVISDTRPGFDVENDYAYTGWDKVGSLDLLIPRSIDVVDNYAYVCVGDSIFYDFHVVDVSDPENPIELSSINTDIGVDVSVKGDYAYIANGNQGYSIIDISNPYDPLIVGLGDIPNSVKIELDGNYAFIAGGYAGLTVVDIFDPANPETITTIDMFEPDRIVIDGNIAYVIEFDLHGAGTPGTNGLTVIDISDRENPEILSSIDTYGPKSLTVDGDYVYIADSHHGLKIVDVSNPSQPVIIGGIDTANAKEVAIKGDYAFIADSDFLIVVNIENKTAPFIAASFSGRFSCISISDNYAFLRGNITYKGELHSFDISDPTNPVALDSLEIDSINQIAIYNDYAFLLVDGGIKVIDIHDPSNLSIFSMDDSCYGQRIRIKGNHAYLSSAGSFRAIDISDPGNLIVYDLIRLTSDFSRSNENDVDIIDNYAYVSKELAGLIVIKLWD